MLGHPFGLAQGTVPGQGLVDLLEVGTSPVPEHLDKGNEHIAHHGAVVGGPVVVEIGQLQMAADDVQLVFPQLRQKVLGQRQGVQPGGRKVDAVPAAALPNEAHVKFRVVGGQGTAGGKVQEGADGLLLGGGPLEHIVSDPRQVDDGPTQGTLRIGKGLKAVGDLSMVQNHRADLSDPVLPGLQAGGLQIEADDGAVQVLVQVTVESEPLVHVVDIVGLHAQDGLDLVPGGVEGVRERLGHPVVGDGDGRMPPLDGTLDHFLGVGQSVHGGHPGMEVKLHPLLRGVIGLHGLFRRFDGKGLQDHIVVKPVDVQPAGDLQVHPRADALHDGLPLVAGHEFVDPDGGGVVGDIKVYHPGVPPGELLMVCGEDVALYHHDPHVQLQGVHGNGGLSDPAGAIDAFGMEPAVLLLLGLGLFHGLQPQGLGLLEDALFLGERSFFLQRRLLRRRGRFVGKGDLLLGQRGLGLCRRLRFRGRCRLRFRDCLVPRLLLGAVSGSGRQRAQGDPLKLIKPRQVCFDLAAEGRVRWGGRQQVHPNGPGLPVHHRAGDRPGLQNGGCRRVRPVLGKQFKKRKGFLWHRSDLLNEKHEFIQ